MFEPVSELGQAIDDAVKSSQKILINLHVGADYDSIGSALGLAEILRHQGKNVTVYSQEAIDVDISSNRDILVGYDDILFCEYSQLKIEQYDLFFCLDSEQPSRLSRTEEVKTPFPITTIVIDHHVANKGFGDINLIMGQTCTSELVFRLALANEWKIPKTATVCLFAGLWSDTGQFMHPGSTTHETYNTAAELIKTGDINFQDLIWRLKVTDDRVLQIAGKSISNLERYFSGKVVFTQVKSEDIRQGGLDANSINPIKEFIAHNLSYTRKAAIIAVFMDRGGWYKVSLRSNNLQNLLDVRKIATRFPNGGGHARAAGLDLQMDLETAKKELIEAIKKEYPELGEA